MAARTLVYRSALFTLLREIQYTLSQMNEEPLAAPYAPTFQGLREKWQTILLAEIAILDALAKAQAAVDRADKALDRFAVRVAHALEEHTSGATQKQLRATLFKGKPLSRFRRFVLGKQLLDMADWSEKLLTCGVPALAAMAPEAAALFAAGENADQLRTKAQSANRNFRDVGQRKQFIDEVNASRKEVDGALAKLPFQNPALPQDFSEGFFYSESPRDEEETIDEVKASIVDLEAQLAERQAELKRLEDEAAAVAKADEERKAKEGEADDLVAKANELLKQASELRGKSKK